MPTVVCVSDTHGFHRNVAVPPGDVLIHAGDLTRWGTVEDVVDFNSWLGDLPHPHKVVIAGNHDWCFQKRPTEARAALTHAAYLEDSEVTVAGLRIYGSPWQPWFFDWAFNLERGPAIAAKWASIPAGLDVLVTHGPPAGILDRTSRGAAAGCADLLGRVREVCPRLHVFGHIHESYGRRDIEGTAFVNASAYNGGSPVVVDL